MCIRDRGIGHQTRRGNDDDHLIEHRRGVFAQDAARTDSACLLGEYTAAMLDQMIVIVTSACLMSDVYKRQLCRRGAGGEVPSDGVRFYRAREGVF